MASSEVTIYTTHLFRTRYLALKSYLGVHDV